VYRQMDYMQTSDIGFVRDNVFYSWMEGDMVSHFETVRTRLLQSPAVESVTMSNQVPIDVGNSTGGISWDGKDPDEDVLFANMDVDFDFVQTLKMTMAEGRAFDRSVASDTVAFIVNQRGADKLGFEGGTADKELTLQGRKGKIVGVVKDFNFWSLHTDIEPFIMTVNPRPKFGCVIVRAKEGQSAEAIAAVEKLSKEYAPAYPYRYSFLNQDWDAYYKAEGQRGKVFNVLSGLSIIISCLGLFGLSAFSAERRIKELGIRKVMGATVPGLLRLMATEFTVLVMIAAVIGCPVAWYAMNAWLEGYAFHITVGWFTLVAATFICLFVSLGTILYHSLKATSTNPAVSLRYE
jgi:putative ABC transport system permease protein